jgi:hypothetical protein
MSTILAERLSAAATIQTVGLTQLSRRQTTAMTAKNSAASPWQAAREGQTLRAGVPIRRENWQPTAIPKPRFTRARNATSHKAWSPSTTPAKPVGVENA